MQHCSSVLIHFRVALGLKKLACKRSALRSSRSGSCIATRLRCAELVAVSVLCEELAERENTCSPEGDKASGGERLRA